MGSKTKIVNLGLQLVKLLAVSMPNINEHCWQGVEIAYLNVEIQILCYMNNSVLIKYFTLNTMATQMD